MLFAQTFRYLQRFSHRDFIRTAPVKRIKSIVRGLIYRSLFALYPDARSVQLAYRDLQKARRTRLAPGQFRGSPAGEYQDSYRLLRRVTLTNYTAEPL
jgi:hypothetical protein